MDGRAWELTKEEDFWCEPDTMRSNVHYHAAKRGLVVETFRIRGKKVYFQVKEQGDGDEN
jgi:hypothetical protein